MMPTTKPASPPHHVAEDDDHLLVAARDDGDDDSVLIVDPISPPDEAGLRRRLEAFGADRRRGDQGARRSAFAAAATSCALCRAPCRAWYDGTFDVYHVVCNSPNVAKRAECAWHIAL